MLRWIIRALAIAVVDPHRARGARLRGDPRARRAGRLGVDGGRRCPDARAGSSPRASRTAFATRGRTTSSWSTRRSRTRGRSCPTRTRPTGSSCCASRPGRATSSRRRDGTVFVNDIKLDDITTKPFPKQTVPNEQYFLLGDNRSAAIDSRTFGPVLRKRHLREGLRGRLAASRHHVPARHRSSGAPPGPIACD